MKLHPSIIEHWHCRYPDLQLSTKKFYAALESLLKEKAFPYVGWERIERSEAGFLTAKREYLQVTRYDYAFVIFAAPFGKSFFFSWYLKEDIGAAALLEYVPFVGARLMRWYMRRTYYQYDAEIMFRESIRAVVDEALAQMEQDKGLRGSQQALLSAEVK